MPAMTDPAEIAKGLNPDAYNVLWRNGISCGRTQFAAPLMRPLERKGLFERVERKGFKVRWEITALGLAVRAIIEQEGK